MNIGLILPGFSASESDAAIPVQHHLVRSMAAAADVRVLALRYPYRRARYRVFGAEVQPLGYSHRARRGRRLLLWADALLTLRTMHHQRPFDVLHATWADETGALAAWAGKLLNIPVVVTIIGGELVHFAELDYGLQGTRLGRWTVQQAILGATAVIVACRYQRDLLETLPYRPKNVHIIPLGVDSSVFHPATQPTTHPTDAPALIHVGSLIPIKDQATLLRAMTLLPPSVTLDIVGEGPLRSDLDQLAQQLGLADRVRWVGAVPHDQIADYFQRAAIHVLPSRHEGQGMVTLEAAACGTPTVGTAVGILPDHPALGISVPVGDVAGLATAIRQLLDHPDQRHELGRSAAAAVRSHWTLGHTQAALLDLYAALHATHP